MNSFLRQIRLDRSIARPLVMTAMWLTAAGFFGMAYFLSGRRVRVDEAIIFTVAFAGAAAVSAVIALAVGARGRWALEAAVPMVLLMATPIGIAWILSWLAPTLSWNVQALNFFPYRGNVSAAVLGIARQTIPTGAVLGTALGTFVGLMILLARAGLNSLDGSWWGCSFPVLSVSCTSSHSTGSSTSS